MDELEQLYENYLTAQNNLVKYFGLEKMLSLCNIGKINESYWFVDNQYCLNYAEEKDGFTTGECHRLDDGWDEKVCNIYKMGEYVALQVGCGEHYDGKFEIFRKDREIEIPDYLD